MEIKRILPHSTRRDAHVRLPRHHKGLRRNTDNTDQCHDRGEQPRTIPVPHQIQHGLLRSQEQVFTRTIHRRRRRREKQRSNHRPINDAGHDRQSAGSLCRTNGEIPVLGVRCRKIPTCSMEAPSPGTCKIRMARRTSHELAIANITYTQSRQRIDKFASIRLTAPKRPADSTKRRTFHTRNRAIASGAATNNAQTRTTRRRKAKRPVHSLGHAAQ